MKWIALTLCLGMFGCESKKQAAPSSSKSQRSSKVTAPKVAKKPTEGWVKIGGGQNLGGHLVRSAKVAQDAELKPVAYLAASWCPPCIAIERHREDAKMKDAFKGVHVIEIDIDEWKKDELAALGMETSTIPAFFALDKNGKTTGKSIDGGAWGGNIPANMAPPLKKFFIGI